MKPKHKHLLREASNTLADIVVVAGVACRHASEPLPPGGDGLPGHHPLRKDLQDALGNRFRMRRKGTQDHLASMIEAPFQFNALDSTKREHTRSAHAKTFGSCWGLVPRPLEHLLQHPSNLIGMDIPLERCKSNAST